MEGLEEAGIVLVNKIRDAFNRKGLNDTKAARESISYKVVGTRLIIEAKKRIWFANFGRKPDKNYNENSWKKIYPAIERWVKRKINPPEDELFITTKNIADKIQREGTGILKDQAKGLELEIIFDEIMNEILSLVTEKEAESVVNNLFLEFEK